MPVHQGYNGYYFYQYGMHGKKYYFNPFNNKTRLSAYNKARRQGQAIHARKK